jgi:hypothetical protein
MTHMNTRRTFNWINSIAIAVAVVPAMWMARAAPACDQYNEPMVSEAQFASFHDEQDHMVSRVFVERRNSDGAGDVRAHEIKVEIDNGTPGVWIDGEKIPADRLRHETGRIIVLDQDGNEIQSVRIWPDADSDAAMLWHDFHFGADDEAIAGGFGQHMGFAGEPPAVMLGVYMEAPGEALQRHLKFEPDQATIITGVFEGLSADGAGLEEYDIIVAINGDENAGPAQIHAGLRERQPGDRLSLTVIHRGERRTIDVELQAFDAQRMHAAKLHGRATDAGVQRMRLFLHPLDDDRHDAVFVAPEIDGLNMDAREIERIVHEAMRDAMRRTGDKHISADELHERLDAGRAGLDRHMEMLQRRMEELQQMLHRMEEHLKERDDPNDD